MVIPLLFASLPLWYRVQPMQSPGRPVPPALAGAHLGRQGVAAAMRLGFTPATLAASGYSTADAADLLGEVRQRNLFTQVWNRYGAGHATLPTLGTGGAVHQGAPGVGVGNGPGASPPQSADHADDRHVLVEASLSSETASRTARMDRAASGVAIGLPADIAVACSTVQQRRNAAAALVAERRAARLGEPVAEHHATVLSAIRSTTEGVAAAANLGTGLSELRAVFEGTPTGP